MLRTFLLLSLTATLAVTIAVSQNQSPAPTRQTSGLTEAVFQTRAGKVTVYLPGDTAAGDTISGTVVAEPAVAKDPKQQQKNSDELSGYVIELDQNRAHVGDKGVRWKIPATIAAGAIPLLLKDGNGKNLGQSMVPVMASPPALVSNFQIPTLGQSGRPLQLQGPFDGNSANTSVTLGGANIPILAESPRQAILQNSQSTPGVVPVVINENGVTTNGSFRNIRIDLTAPKTNLVRGEQTELKVAVEGLAGLSEPLPLRLQNRTPDVVNIAGGNDQILRVSPGAAPSQPFTRTLTGVRAGQFNIVADLVYINGSVVAQATASPTPLTASGTTPSTTRPTPSPAPALPTSGVPPATGAASPSTTSGMPVPSPAPSNQTIPNVAVPVSPVAPIPMPPVRKENPCCKQIRDANDPGFGTRLVFRQGQNNFELMGPYLFLEVNGVRARWKFDRNLEEVFCYLDKYEIDSEVKQVSETNVKNGQTTEKQETTSLLFSGPDFDNKSARPHKLFQFMASKLGDKNVKEYAVTLSVDEEKCAWTLTLFANNELAEFTSPPPRQPTEIFDDLKADHDLEVAGQRPYTSATWWDIKFRELSEIVQWCGWLKEHPDDQKMDEVRRKAFVGWRINMKRALEDLKANGKNLSDGDRKVMDDMSKLLNQDNVVCDDAAPTLRAFVALWGHFTNTGASF